MICVAIQESITRKQPDKKGKLTMNDKQIVDKFVEDHLLFKSEDQVKEMNEVVKYEFADDGTFWATIELDIEGNTKQFTVIVTPPELNEKES